MPHNGQHNLHSTCQTSQSSPGRFSSWVPGLSERALTRRGANAAFTSKVAGSDMAARKHKLISPLSYREAVSILSLRWRDRVQYERVPLIPGSCHAQRSLNALGRRQNRPLAGRRAAGEVTDWAPHPSEQHLAVAATGH